MPNDVYNSLFQILQLSDRAQMRDLIMKLPESDPFIEFSKYALIDFMLNVKRPRPYNPNDERSIYCEVFIPLFKAFANCTGLLVFTWYF